MALWNQLKARALDMNTQLKSKADQFKNKDFANATTAMCALIAAADGTVDASERAKVAGLIASNDVLKVFPPHELDQQFSAYCDKLTADFEFGKVEVMQVVAKLAPKPDQARAVIQIGIIIGGADGDFDASERAVVRQACHQLNINPQEFDL